MVGVALQTKYEFINLCVQKLIIKQFYNNFIIYSCLKSHWIDTGLVLYLFTYISHAESKYGYENLKFKINLKKVGKFDQKSALHTHMEVRFEYVFSICMTHTWIWGLCLFFYDNCESTIGLVLDYNWEIMWWYDILMWKLLILAT